MGDVNGRYQAEQMRLDQPESGLNCAPVNWCRSRKQWAVLRSERQAGAPNDGRFVPESHLHPCLRLDASAPVDKITADQVGEALASDHWQIHVLNDGRVALQSHIGGKYLRACPDGSVDASADQRGEWEAWTMFHLKSRRNPNMSRARFVMNGAGDFWFEILYAFQSCHGKFLSHDGWPCGSKVTATRLEPRQWELWSLQIRESVVDVTTFERPWGSWRDLQSEHDEHATEVDTRSHYRMLMREVLGGA